jgi:hypothetical protein
LSRDGPGLLLRDILKGDPQVAAVAGIVARVSPDVLLLTGIDYDHGLAALTALAEVLDAAGAAYPHRFAYPPNSGVQTGRDLDGDGRAAGPGDAQGFGRFFGQGGMALLSRLPVDAGASRDFTGFRWADLPGALNAGVWEGQRLSSVGHWDVALGLPGGGRLHLLAWHATPPVFDGPEDRNGRRNHDEAAFWIAYLDGRLQWAPPEAPVVLLGDANADPMDGEAVRGALGALLSDPRLQDPQPSSAGGVAASARDGGVNAGHGGDPAHDTADWRDGPGEAGNLRVDYVLPSAGLEVVGAGVHWPVEGAEAEDAAAASRHRLVWVDVVLP